MNWTGPIQKITEDKAREVESLNKDSESVEVDKKESFLGMTGFDGMVPLDGMGNIVGTLSGAAAVGNTVYKVRNGYEIKKDFDRKNKRVLVRESYDSVKDNKKVNGRHRDHKIYYVNDIEKKSKMEQLLLR
ncbi:hypothetical protein JDS77_28505 [Bacillus cereus group sp. N28]|nr:hypothetical protein IKO_05752 [Bacillus cereus VDM034]EJS10951.1 hypothetical protein IKS_05772 [Bacillus cereus VDM062]MBG9685603.1 hypothetical protein [Bacillus mycoides]MBJ7961559.1 hypothetical protein [Bacillus cereus group sp. N28]PRD05606.1 hypothetical protein CQ058_30160 [Bacillus sp. MYb56]